MPRKLVLIVIDGMTPAAFERAVESGAPALSFLAEHGDYRRATSVFPSLTPVCLTSIATGAGPGVHHIPSLVWWNRRGRRIPGDRSAVAAPPAARPSPTLRGPSLHPECPPPFRHAGAVLQARGAAVLV